MQRNVPVSMLTGEGRNVVGMAVIQDGRYAQEPTTVEISLFTQYTDLLGDVTELGLEVLDRG